MNANTNASPVLEIQNQPGFSIIRFFGFVDAATVESVKPVISAKLPAGCGSLIISLEQVEFLDSHGVGLFVSLLKRAHALKGRLVFAGARDQPAAVLEMVGFNSQNVTYCGSLQQACALLGERT